MDLQVIGGKEEEGDFLLERNYPSWCHKFVRNESLARGKLYCHARCKLYLSFLSPDGRQVKYCDSDMCNQKRR